MMRSYRCHSACSDDDDAVVAVVVVVVVEIEGPRHRRTPGIRQSRSMASSFEADDADGDGAVAAA